MATRLEELERLVRDLSTRSRNYSEERGADNGHNVGQLLTDGHGKSRLVTKSFWALVSDEIEDLNTILSEDSENDWSPLSPLGLPSLLDASGIPGCPYDLTQRDGLALAQYFRPSSLDIQILWPYYTENVDPILRILHKPTLEIELGNMLNETDQIDKETEVLLLAICFASASSLNSAQAMDLFGHSHTTLVALYGLAVKHALNCAQLIQTQDLKVLQAFVLFLSCMKCDNPRTVWTLTGLAIRVAQALGLHRDGSHFALSPFEAEMRRRLWWHICLLDMRSSEDSGTDITILPQSFDTRMPLNINDSDLEKATQKLEPRQGCTEMTLSLIRYESWSTLVLMTATYRPCHCRKDMAFEQKECALAELSTRLQEKYLRYCDLEPSVPLYKLSSMVARLSTSKMRLFIRYPFRHRNGDPELISDDQNELLEIALELLNFQYRLGQDNNLKRWVWFSTMHMQWHALAFVLAQLCVRKKGKQVDRCWDIIEQALPTDPNASSGNTPSTWRPLMRLKEKALQNRFGQNLGQTPIPEDLDLAETWPLASFDGWMGLEELQYPIPCGALDSW